MKHSSKCANLVCRFVLITLAGEETALWGQTGGFAYVANCGSPWNIPAAAVCLLRPESRRTCS